MKNKKLLYILIPCTLVLWGIIVYKIVRVTSGNNDFESSVSVTIDKESDTKFGKDTFSIKANYRDPFFGNKFSTNRVYQESNSNTQQTIPAHINKPQQNIPKNDIATSNFPNVVYNGIIQNKQTNKSLAIVQINGQSNIMKVGDVFNEVEILKISKDSIEVKFQKEKRFVLK